MFVREGVFIFKRTLNIL